MKEQINIDFCGFGLGFDKQNNFIYNELAKNYEIRISNQPDILFFSCFNLEYLTYRNCKKVFWAGENIRPDFDGADYCISFDYNKNSNHYRFPLWVLYIEETELTRQYTTAEVELIMQNKTKFCAMLVSYCKSQKRKDIFKFLSEYKRIDSGGKCLNNMDNKKVDNVSDFFAPYKFSLCFENSSYAGYSTEKIFNALKANCVPIYWGDETLKNDINPKKYISLHDFNSEKEFLEYIIEVDNNESLYRQYLKEPILIDGKIPEYYKRENLRNFLIKIVEDEMPPEKTFRQRVKHFLHNYYFKYKWDRTFGFK